MPRKAKPTDAPEGARKAPRKRKAKEEEPPAVSLLQRQRAGGRGGRGRR